MIAENDQVSIVRLCAEAPAGSDFFQSYGAQRGADPGSEGGRHWQSDVTRPKSKLHSFDSP